MSQQLPLGKRLIAETIGTFSLVFAGTAAIVIDRNTAGAVSHVGVALTFGLVVFAMIAALGDVSGAHLNPAVTVGFTIARRFEARCMVPYIVCQCIGAIIASGCVRVLFPDSQTLGGTHASGSILQTFVLEVLLTAGLMFVILGVSSGAREKGLTAGLAVGGVVALEALFAGPISGASMNPARSLAPALVGFDFLNLWIYLTAPFVGATIAVAGCRCSREAGCCVSATIRSEGASC